MLPGFCGFFLLTTILGSIRNQIHHCMTCNLHFFSAKDGLYNKVCQEMVSTGCKFPRYLSDAIVQKRVGVITDTLWYLDGSTSKIMERSEHCQEMKPIPERYIINLKKTILM